MARVTVEDCVVKIPNRFELVMIAGQRARDISSGARLTVDRDNDKNPVVALREIADETVSLDLLRNALVTGLQKHVEVDEPEDEEMAPMVLDRDMMVQEVASDDEIGEDMLSVQEEGPEFGEGFSADDLGNVDDE